MSLMDPYDFMEQAWQLEANPFPPEAIRLPGQPFSRDVFADEVYDYRRKLVRGAVLAGRGIGYLWSQGRTNDTGFGKTTLMMETAREITPDLGASVLENAGMRRDRLVPIAATYSNLNNLDASGLYPVLFASVVDASTSVDNEPALLDVLRREVLDRADVSGDPGAIKGLLAQERVRCAPGGAPLRPELVTAFAMDGAFEVLRQLGLVSGAARMRNGLQYLDFLLTVCAAAGVDHLFIFVDQLEDLAQNKSITAAKRSREIGRIRDLLEAAPYAGRVHFVFTLHNQAAQVLSRFWEQNRLPPFEVSPANAASMVVLRGLQNDDQVASLLRVYLEEKRLEPVDDDLLPFEPGALTVLKDASEGRVGILLNQAHQVLNEAAERNVPRISGAFASQLLAGGQISLPGERFGEEGDTGAADDLDDLILGG